MSKVRVLLFLLALSFAVTALTINLTFHKNNVLLADAQTIESNLHEKEKFVSEFLNNPETFESLKTIETHRELAEETIKNLRHDRKIFLYTYRDNELLFWGGNQITPQSDAGLKEGSNFLVYKSGYYEAIKKSEGNFSAVCYILIKNRFPFENRYLQNVFAPDLIKTNHLDIAGLNDNSIYSVRNIGGKYLFSVKLKASEGSALYSKYELWAWILAVFTGFLFINYVCSWLAAKGRIKASIALLFTLFLLFRLALLQFHWLGTHFGLEIFKPVSGASNFFFPSIGDFLVNSVCVTWFLIFAYRYRSVIMLPAQSVGKVVSYIVFTCLGIIIALMALQLNDVFQNLVLRLPINFDVSKIINLDYLSWLGILLLCFAILNIYLLTDILLAVGGSLQLTNLERLIIFLSGIIVLLIAKIIDNNLNVLFLLFALIILIRGWSTYTRNDEFNMGILVTVVLIFAVISSVKLSEFQDQKELVKRKQISLDLSSPADSNAVKSFRDIEDEILKDDDISLSFTTHDYNLLKNKLQKFYFDGYLSRYEFTAYQYNPIADDTLSRANQAAVEKFKNLVVSGSRKVSKYFYQINDTFGYKDFFAIIPISQNGLSKGTLFIELKSAAFYNSDASPAILASNNIEFNEEYKSYSFAFYKGGKLIGQYGKYIYSLTNNEFYGILKDFVFTEKKNYSHLVYQPNKQLLVIVSRPNTSFVLQLASVSFIFLVLLFFAGVCVVLYWIGRNLEANSNVLQGLRWGVFASSKRMLYKTRIQASMVAAVVSTLVLVGLITYFSISKQYQEQQQQTVLENINKITIGFEKKMFTSGGSIIDEQAFTAFADFNAVDLTYYDVHGKEMFTTQPKVYEFELVSPRINPLAYIYLNNYQQSEYLNPDERIGALNFLAAYKPIRNNNNETVGYLGLLYFSNVHDFEDRIGLFLNTLINVYALVFVAIGFFAVFVANRITAPLTLVQKSLSQIKIGRKNEPIVWKRDDEIGSLIKEYNNMIEALDESAHRLASSERETAWKEMAKQVAHEIKNPLTPLKLGVQLLDKSWREKDPNFDRKFERFSKSFIEQIESLAHIASEFSNFAKMPETILEDVDLREVVERSIEVYSKVEHVNIVLTDNLGRGTLVRGDKDQLLRCFNNLIKNAIEAIPDGREGSIAITINGSDRHAHVQIADNGKGIPEGLRERIFNPNFTTKSSGTGLGLAFIKQAIGNMSGSISFTTENDRGTTFFITLPLA
ncbi:MAG: integral rane sensor signal transduction histidine kinase [Sphingobacteriaceae bacterium]|nr:integral rane sensor signal transduction histidine kinase [Sphingobacteriaceae bacterium]